MTGLSRTIRWSGLVTLVVAAITLTLMPLALSTSTPSPDDLIGGTMPLWWLVAGLVVMAKRPWHQVGWLLTLTGLGLATTGWGMGSEAYKGADPRTMAWLAWVSTWGGYLTFGAMVALLIVFPDGQSGRPEVSRRWGRSIVGLMAVLTLLTMVSDPIGGVDTAFPESSNPLGAGLIPASMIDFLFVFALLILLGCVGWMGKRWAVESGESRNRYTLILYSFSLLIIALAGGLILSEPLGEDAWIPAFLLWFLVPVAFSVAVIRNGLYGVDRLVRRTLSYGLVAAVISAIYTIPILVIPSILGQRSELVIAGSTLVAAAAFNPVRTRIRRIVERRFNRSRYDAQHEVQALAERLMVLVDPVGIQADLIGVVERTMQPQVQMVWIKT